MQTYDFNNKYHLRPDIKLTKSHFYPSNTDKMRNHLAEEVLSEDFLDLMIKYQATIEKPQSLESCIKLLSNTAVIVNIFSNIHSPIDSLSDGRVAKILKVIEFFTQWENQFQETKEKERHLMTKETRQDILSSLIGFIEVLKLAVSHDISITPGYFNSDIIENWFCPASWTETRNGNQYDTESDRASCECKFIDRKCCLNEMQ